MTRTVQMRRYVLRDGEVDAYLDWWTRYVRPLRIESGFDVVGAWLDESTRIFTWVVAAPGDVQDFLRREAAYKAAPGRSAAGEGVPDRVESGKASFVREYPS